MKRTPLWILVTIAVLLLASTLIWNFSMQAAHPTGRGTRGRGAASNPAKENFDIGDRRSEDAVLKFERRMEKLSSRHKEKNAGFNQAMRDAEEGDVLWRKNITEDQTQPATYVSLRWRGVTK